jgi:hypothetical protein
MNQTVVWGLMMLKGNAGSAIYSHQNLDKLLNLFVLSFSSMEEKRQHCRALKTSDPVLLCVSWYCRYALLKTSPLQEDVENHTHERETIPISVYEICFIFWLVQGKRCPFMSYDLVCVPQFFLGTPRCCIQ